MHVPRERVAGIPMMLSCDTMQEPIMKQDDVRPAGPEFHGQAGWPATPKLVPVVIVCK